MTIFEYAIGYCALALFISSIIIIHKLSKLEKIHNEMIGALYSILRQ